MDTGGYGVGGFEIWRLWVPPATSMESSRRDLSNYIAEQVYLEK